MFGANERLQVAGIGVGGKGKSDFDHTASHGDVVAARDVDSRRLDAGPCVAIPRLPSTVTIATCWRSTATR